LLNVGHKQDIRSIHVKTVRSTTNLNVLERWSVTGLFVPALQHQVVQRVWTRWFALAQAGLGHPVAPLNLFQYFSIHHAWQGKQPLLIASREVSQPNIASPDATVAKVALRSHEVYILQHVVPASERSGMHVAL